MPNVGLSPRVRGNPVLSRSRSASLRSIPARTGEPNGNESLLKNVEVYPRAYGGTSTVADPATSKPGLSPRVRGNHLVFQVEGGDWRSIPARTGEPVKRVEKTCQRTVYPRAYGGTASSVVDGALSRGLSPRVRGNRGKTNAEYLRDRSIPARTGEPGTRFPWRRVLRVYPRAYGGTPPLCHCQPYHEGLSPRVRGNQPVVTFIIDTLRSIPARTGEPPGTLPASFPNTVYPRAYGGTLPAPCRFLRNPGLSPRVRGNPPMDHPGPTRYGSIPARTGEP